MIKYTTHGPVAVISLNAPPVNALGTAMRGSLMGLFRTAVADDAIQAILLRSDLPLFCGGADIQEFLNDELKAPPFLPAMCDEIDDAPKLVIAAINGVAMGGAVEISLACDYRVALPGAKLGLPEINLGLLPGAGGTQRLPRIAGVKTAVDVILSGKPISASDAHAAGLVDRILEDAGNFEEKAIAFAKELIETDAPLRPCRDMAVDMFSVPASFFDEKRSEILKRFPGQEAPVGCLASIENACHQSLEAGLESERAGFMRLLSGPQARARIHLFFAERAARKIPGVPADLEPRSIRRVAVIGAGTMGSGITLAFADAGYPVTVLEMSDKALANGMEGLTDHYHAMVAKGRATEEQAAVRRAQITGTLDYTDLSDADLVIEAVFENMDIKKQVFARLDETCKPGAVLASNTSTLDLNEIASATGRPEDVIGLHFFSPANIMRLLEIVRGDQTSPDVIQTALKTAQSIRKVPVVVGVCYGFVGNRMLEPYFREASRMMLEGAGPAQIDRVLTDFGFAMGIVSVGDLAGIDVGYKIRESRRDTIAHDPTYQAIQDRLAEMGRFGQKTQRGAYIYDGREKKDDPEVVRLCEELAAAHGIERRAISDREILERCLYPLINEGVQILDEGMAYRSGDCDIIWANGYGFPAWRGGPMHYAEEIGLDRVLNRLHHYRETLGEYGEMWFRPAPMLERLVASGGKLADIRPT